MSQNQQDQAALARQYAEHFKITPQQDGEGDITFRHRVAGTLRDAGHYIEAHEAFNNERYEVGGDALTGITGALALALQGRETESGSRQISEDFAAGVIAQSPKPDMSFAEMMLLMMMGDAQRPSHQESAVLSRVRELRLENKTGVEIARVLHAEGHPIQEARDAFFDLGYVVSIQPFTTDIQELHVSDRPMEAGLAALILMQEPRALPSVVWR